MVLLQVSVSKYVRDIKFLEIFAKMEEFGLFPMTWYIIMWFANCEIEPVL